jgi:hypothetical protein
MMPDAYDLEDLLRTVEFSRLPKQHSQRTAECPHPSLYVRYARTGWPKDLVEHARACPYCQKSKAAAWSIECPGWGELQNYLQDSNYPDRVAVERHLEWTGCGVCAARLELLKFLDGAKRVLGWVATTTDDHRRTVQCRFAAVGIGDSVMGEPTKTYECNLMYLLEELGVADEFETFKLFCETGKGTTVSATLVPRKRGDGNKKAPLEVSLYLSRVEAPAPRRGRPPGDSPRPVPLHLRLYADETSTPKMSFNEMGDPTKFEGKLDIRIREVAWRDDESTDG